MTTTHKTTRKPRRTASFDDWQNAYDEAAGHLEYLSAIPTDQTPGERLAQRQLAARLRAAAKRMNPHDKTAPHKS